MFLPFLPCLWARSFAFFCLVYGPPLLPFFFGSDKTEKSTIFGSGAAPFFAIPRLNF